MGHIQKRKKFQKRNMRKWHFNHEMMQFTKGIHDAFIKWFEAILDHHYRRTIALAFPVPASETGVESYDTNAKKFPDCEQGV